MRSKGTKMAGPSPDFQKKEFIEFKTKSLTGRKGIAEGGKKISTIKIGRI